MDPFANKAWLAKLMYGRGGPNGLRPASKFYISGWERPSQVIAAVRTVSESADDVIVFPLRELSQVEIIAHKLVVRQTKEVQNGDARPDNASPPVFEGSGGQHVSSLKENQSRSDKPLRANMKSQRRKFAEDIGDGGHGRSRGAGRPAINRQSTNKAPTLAGKQSGGAAACPYGTTDSRRNHIAGRSGGQKAQPPRLEAEWALQKRSATDHQPAQPVPPTQGVVKKRRVVPHIGSWLDPNDEIVRSFPNLRGNVLRLLRFFAAPPGGVWDCPNSAIF